MSLDAAIAADAFWQLVRAGLRPCLRGHVFDVAATGEDSIDSGRPRYRVECVTCGQIIHEATNAPMLRIEQHLIIFPG